MGHIRESKKRGHRWQAEINIKGFPRLTKVFDRKTDAKEWIQKTEADMRAGCYQPDIKSKQHTFSEAVERYMQEIPTSVVKRGHLEWWQKELGEIYLQDIRPSLLSEKNKNSSPILIQKGS